MAQQRKLARLSTQLTDGFYEALGHTIKVARTDLNIDRKALAERAGISYSYLAAIENGQKQPSSQVLLVLAEALGLRTHELLESAEGRQERNLNPTEEYPGWLAPQTRRGAPAVRRRVALESFVDDSVEQAPRRPDRDRFLAEMERLGVSMAESDRQLLLEMARKLAG